jgi:hypothetical protein
MKAAQRDLSKLLRATAHPRFGDWTSSAAKEPKNPQRAKGSLSQGQLAAAEKFALTYGVSLPSPTNPSGRESALVMVWQQIQNARVALPSVAGDALADAQKAARTR